MVGALAVASPHPLAACRGRPARLGGAGGSGIPPNPRRALGPGIPGALGDLGEGSGAEPPALPVKFTPGPRPGSWIHPTLLGFWVPITGVSSSWPAFGVQGVRGGPAPGPFWSPVCCVHSLWLERGLGWALWTEGTSRAQAQFQQPLGQRHPQASEEAPQYVFPKG